MRIQARSLAGLLMAGFVGVALLINFLVPAPKLATSTDNLTLADAAEKQDKDALRSFLRQRLDVNARQADGATALHWAAHWDDLDTANLLIHARADVNATNEYGVMPLWLACTMAAPRWSRNCWRREGMRPWRHLGRTPLMHWRERATPTR
jgi:ankyrin repeat protein